MAKRSNKVMATIKLGPAATDRSNILILGHGILKLGQTATVPAKDVVPGGLFTRHITAGLIEVVEGVKCEEKVIEASEPVAEIVETVEVVEPDPDLDPTPLQEPAVEVPKKRRGKNSE